MAHERSPSTCINCELLVWFTVPSSSQRHMAHYLSSSLPRLCSITGRAGTRSLVEWKTWCSWLRYRSQPSSKTFASDTWTTTSTYPDTTSLSILKKNSGVCKLSMCQTWQVQPHTLLVRVCCVFSRLFFEGELSVLCLFLILWLHIHSDRV